MVTFSTTQYPQNKPTVSVQPTDIDIVLKSKDRDVLNQCIADHIAENEYA